MFFTRCIVNLVGCLPVSWKATRRIRFALKYDDRKKKVIAWHQAKLEKLDPMFYLQRTSPALVEDWKKAVAEYS
ncbi:MAG: hypothetical protein WAV50_00880 [Minisyncoccia bacterium]